MLSELLKQRKTKLAGEYELPRSEWDKTYFRTYLVWLSDNFCEERLQKAKEIGKVVYEKEYTFGKDEAENVFDKIENHLAEANKYSKELKTRGVVVFAALLASAAGLIKLTKDTKKKKRIKEITEEIRKTQKDLKSGEISEDEAETRLKKCESELRQLFKSEKKFLKEQAKIKKKLDKENKKSVKESVLLDIYESERNGDITEEERDMLLEMID